MEGWGEHHSEPRARENIVTEHALNSPEYLLFWRSSTVHQPGWSAAQEPSLPSSMKSWRNAREKQSHTVQKHWWQRHCNKLCVMKCKEHHPGKSSSPCHAHLVKWKCTRWPCSENVWPQPDPNHDTKMPAGGIWSSGLWTAGGEHVKSCSLKSTWLHSCTLATPFLYQNQKHHPELSSPSLTDASHHRYTSVEKQTQRQMFMRLPVDTTRRGEGPKWWKTWSQNSPDLFILVIKHQITLTAETVVVQPKLLMCNIAVYCNIVIITVFCCYAKYFSILSASLTRDCGTGMTPDAIFTRVLTIFVFFCKVVMHLNIKTAFGTVCACSSFLAGIMHLTTSNTTFIFGVSLFLRSMAKQCDS